MMLVIIIYKPEEISELQNNLFVHIQSAQFYLQTYI